MSRAPSKPAWWKNTYFWIGGILLVVAVWGLVRGPGAIRDPGQKREDHLVVWLYLIGGIIMLANGWLSHKQTMQHYAELQDGIEEPVKPVTVAVPAAPAVENASEETQEISG